MKYIYKFWGLWQQQTAYRKGNKAYIQGYAKGKLVKLELETREIDSLIEALWQLRR